MSKMTDENRMQQLPKPWSVYLVRAQNGALYCGISDNPERRFASHCSGKGARFFHTSPAQALVYVEVCGSKGDALRRERAIKRLAKTEKERMSALFLDEQKAAGRALLTRG